MAATKALPPLAKEPGYAKAISGSPASAMFMALSHVLGSTVNADGHVVHDDAPTTNAASLKNFTESLEKMWNVTLLMDTLLFAMLLPILIDPEFGGLTPADGMSEATASALLNAIDVILAITIFIVFSHANLVLMLYIATAYVGTMTAPTIAWFLLHNRNLLLAANYGQWPASLCTLLAGAVACVYTRGVTVGSVTVMALFGTAILLSFVVFYVIFGGLQKRMRLELGALRKHHAQSL